MLENSLIFKNLNKKLHEFGQAKNKLQIFLELQLQTSVHPPRVLGVILKNQTALAAAGRRTLIQRTLE